MSLELCILASGSAGNASILRSPTGVLLIDVGISPRALAERLDGTGVRPADISALLLTHLDGDHFSPRWTSTLLRLNIPVYCHANKLDGLAVCSPDFVPLIRLYHAAAFAPIDTRKHPAKLSITHISGPDIDAYLDVGQAGQAAPHDDVAGWWIAGSGEIAAEARELGQIVR